MSLEGPRAEMMMHAGAVVVMTAATAIYQPQAQLLDLFDDVTLVHQNGTRFLTKSAHVDVAANTAEGHDPVSGHGPSGDIAAQGFKILDKGDRVIFTGEANLVLKGSRPTRRQRIAAGIAGRDRSRGGADRGCRGLASGYPPLPAPPPPDVQNPQGPTDAAPPRGGAGGPVKARARASAGGRPGKA